MKKNIPDILLKNFDKIKIKFCSDCNFNQTKDSIVITGSENSFFTLSNILLFYLNELEEEINFSKLPNVESNDIDLTIKIDNDQANSDGLLIKTDDNIIVWFISESNLTEIVAGSLHSLSYGIDHVHIDENMNKTNISIYCSLEL